MSVTSLLLGFSNPESPFPNPGLTTIPHAGDCFRLTRFI
ncbi:hypothetical protein HEP75_03718 [Xanthomonas sp. SI]|nr:hypothetical protein HEP75_03718 [Xanthomonas sp. SI]